MNNEEKRELFVHIKREAPDFAEFLGEVSRVFGKPVAIHGELHDGTVIAIGPMTLRKNFTTTPKMLENKRSFYKRGKHDKRNG